MIKRPMLNILEPMRSIRIILLFLFVAEQGARAQNASRRTTQTSGNKAIVVYANPSAQSRVIARVSNTASNLRIAGEPVWSERQEWFPATISGEKGWIQLKTLDSKRPDASVAIPPPPAADLPAVDLSIPADWKPHSRPWTRVYGSAANGMIDEARRRLARGESGTLDDIRYGWADYLYQQRQLKVWVPIVIGIGVKAADAMLKADAGVSADQESARVGAANAALEYDKQRREENERRDAETRANAERVPY